MAEKGSQISNLSFYLKKLEKKAEQIQNKQKEIKAELSAIKNR